MRDMDQKGRRVNAQPRGEKNGFAKLTESDVLRIMALRRDGMTQSAIGMLFGVTQANVSSILLGHTWGHVRYPANRRAA